jgi:hypothetical protein
MLRSVQKYGEDIAEDLALPKDYSANVEGVAAAAMRQAIESARPAAAIDVSQEEVSALKENGSFADTMLPSREQNIADEYEFTQVMGRSSEVSAGELAFMARCVLRSAVQAKDPAVRKQSQYTLAWLQSNEATKSVVEQVMHPVTARSKRAIRIGHSALTQVRLAPQISSRRIRSRVA